jgi:hypothetical protein
VSPSSLILATGLAAPGALTTDATSLYWLDPKAYTVNRISKSGGPVATLAANQYDLVNDEDATNGPAPGLQITLDDSYVYWAANGVLRTRKDGTGSVETVTSATGRELAIIGSNLYLWTTVYAPSSTLGLGIVPVSGGTPVPYAFTPMNIFGTGASDGVSLYLVGEVSLAGFAIYKLTPPSSSLVSTGFEGEHITCCEEIQLGPGGVYFGAYYGFLNPQIFSVDGPFSASSTTAVPWSPGPCGVILAGAQGLEQNGVVLLASSTVSSLGGLTEFLYDDGYVYFSDGNGEIGKLPVR